MPWSQNDYPSAFNNLSPPVRKKAIEVANALLREGHNDGSAIRIAITQANKNKGHNKAARYQTKGLAKVALDYFNES